MSLKFARAQDLPSFPSVGIAKDGSAHSAANLAHGNQTSFEWWKPEASAAAEKAALLAHDYKMAPLWQPEASAAASKASLLAHSGPGREWWHPTASKEGDAAAKLAVKNTTLSPQLDYGYTDTGRKNALLAATNSVRRKRAATSPELQPPSSPMTAEPGLDDPAMEAARVQHMSTTAMPRSLFTEHPPISAILSDRLHQDALKASALSFANQLYKVQQVDSQGHISVAGHPAAAKASNGLPSLTEANLKQQALQYLTLQDAAQRLAAERLTKIQTEQEARAFREYWGYPERKPGNRLSVRRATTTRKRASSDGTIEGPRSPRTPHDKGFYDVDSDEEDAAAARRVRSQMNQLNESIGVVDAQRRTADRKALLAAAEKKVQESMKAMDEKVFNETGKMSAAMMEEWDAKARERAKANSDARVAERSQGKVSVGGGKYLDRREIEEIARARVQPTLDRVGEEAERQRARDEERRLDGDERKRQARVEKERQAEVRTEERRLKGRVKRVRFATMVTDVGIEEEKKARREERHASKAVKEQRKAEKAEEKRLAKEEQRKAREAQKVDAAMPPKEDRPATAESRATAATATTLPEVDVGPNLTQELTPQSPIANVDVVAHRNASIDEGTAPERPSVTKDRAEVPKFESVRPSRLSRIIPHSGRKDKEKDEKTPETPGSPTSPKKDGGVKRLLTKLKRRSKDADEKEESSFAGGAALKDRPSGDAASHDHDSISSLSSDEEEEGEDHGRGDRGRQISRVSAISGNEEFEEARDAFDERLAPPPSFSVEGNKSLKSGSPVREARFHEEL